LSTFRPQPYLKISFSLQLNSCYNTEQ
jgi:hypothetical protein